MATSVANSRSEIDEGMTGTGRQVPSLSDGLEGGYSSLAAQNPPFRKWP